MCIWTESEVRFKQEGSEKVIGTEDKKKSAKEEEETMANKWINEMSLSTSIANIFIARNITTAKEVLSLTEFEFMELLDVGMVQVTFVVAHISEIVFSLTQTALSLWHTSGKLFLHQCELPCH